MSDLCWKCKEKMQELYSQGLGHLTFQLFDQIGHCHGHDEPKEKEKCWCEDPNDEDFVHGMRTKWISNLCGGTVRG